jgi:carboxylesterase type B
MLKMAHIFQPPQEAPSWEGERKAQKEGSDCTQRHFMIPQYLGSEDCLFLNVYSPKVSINPIRLYRTSSSTRISINM